MHSGNTMKTKAPKTHIGYKNTRVRKQDDMLVIFTIFNFQMRGYLREAYINSEEIVLIMDSVDKSIQMALKIADRGTRDETKTAISMIKLSFHSYLKSMNEYIEAMDKFNKSAVAPSPKKTLHAVLLDALIEQEMRRVSNDSVILLK